MIEIDLLKKHGKKALGLETHQPHKQTWRQRLPEILLEIGIIVFAITLSIQLHAWHERSAERRQERQFLIGLRADLQADLRELSQDSLFYVQKNAFYRELLALPPGQSLPAHKPAEHGASFYSTTNLVPNTSRYEGFKSAGKLGLIENEKLLNTLLDLYQEQVPSLLDLTESYFAFTENRLNPYLDEHLDARDTQMLALLRTERMQRYLRRGRNTKQVLDQYHTVLQQSSLLIGEINKNLAEN